MPVFAYLYIDPLLDAAPSDALLSEDDTWGEPVDGVYRDLGDRHQFHQMITDCQTFLAAPSTDVQLIERSSIRLIIRHLGELGDSIEEVSDRLLQLDPLNIELLILEPPASPLHHSATPSAHLEQLERAKSLHTRQRTRTLKRGHAQNRLQAKPPPGRAPYGYKRGKDRYLLDRSTAPVVKDFFEHFLLYGSLRRSVRYLSQKYNKKISVSTGQRWLSNPVYRGHLTYTTGDTISNTHQAILSDDEAAQIDRLLRRNRQLPRRSASAERSLAGLVRCADCQSPMTITRVSQRGKKKDYLYLRPTQCRYKCPQKESAKKESTKEAPSQSMQTQPPNRGSNEGQTTRDTHESQSPPACKAIPYDQVLQQTIESICETLPQIISRVPLPDLGAVKQQIQAQITEKRHIIDQLPDLERSGILDSSTTTLRRYTIQGEISALQTSLAQLPPVNLQATVQEVSLRQFWLDLSESERRFYFREFIHHIEITRPKPNEPLWETRLVLLLEKGQPGTFRELSQPWTDTHKRDRKHS